MPKYNRKQKIDQNIISALNNLPKIMKNNSGNNVTIRETANKDETGIEHIANSTHGLQVKDIESIPNILLKPYYSCLDPVHIKRKNYYGKKNYNHKFKCFIKIVTDIKHDNSEKIVTIYLVDKIK